MVPFGGWDMPVQYTGIVDEHLSTRTNAGLFDISHMGEIFIEGKIQSKINNSDTISVEVNNIKIGKCKFELTLSSCVLEFKNLLNGTGPVQIRFIPENPISSKALNLSDETIPYGLGLISVQLARD